jgi:hypothetical protein
MTEVFMVLFFMALYNLHRSDGEGPGAKGRLLCAQNVNTHLIACEYGEARASV